MKQSEKVLTAAEIRSLNLNKSDVLSYDYRYNNGVDNYYLLVNGNIIASFPTGRMQVLTDRKIKSMGLATGWNKPQLTDEEIGISEAAKNGENPFAFTIMCANPALNEIVK